MDFNAKDYSIIPGKEISVELSKLLKEISETSGQKRLVFEKGTYYLNAETCDEKMLYITNTVGDEEFKSGETPHLNKIGINLQGISDLEIEGNSSEFIIDGKATNMAIENCQSITINDIEIDVVNPDMHELTVEKVTPFTVTYKLDSVSKYEAYKDRFAFVGTDYKTDFYAHRATAFWTGLIRKETPNNLKRVRQPFLGAISISEKSKNIFTAKYFNTSRFKVGDKFYVYDARRQYAGIFVNSSKNITLSKVKQRFNYSLALVCQDTENITVDNVDFSPSSDKERLVASCADFIQLCMCKGQINVTNSNFSGAGDDMLNVHGVHFKVSNIHGNELTVKFMHSQSHGYNPLHKGDLIDFVNPSTLDAIGKAEITDDPVLIEENTIKLTVSNTNGLTVGDVIEDTTMCPNLYFANNTLNRIITRNLLITTRGKVVVENNKFLNSTMASILFSDDAKNWYESGRVLDAEIKNNYFGECYAEFIQALPENGKNKNIVHKNIIITGNTFDSNHDKGLSFKCTQGITITNNTIKSSASKNKFVKTKDCLQVNSDI